MVRQRYFRLPLSLGLVLALGAVAFAQPASTQPAADPGVVPDDMLTLVVGTRFVPAPDGADAPSAHALFTRARIPLSAFNETDHCIDQAALEVAQEYFTALGRLLGKAGHYYFVPTTQWRSPRSCARGCTASPRKPGTLARPRSSLSDASSPQPKRQPWNRHYADQALLAPRPRHLVEQCHRADDQPPPPQPSSRTAQNRPGAQKYLVVPKTSSKTAETHLTRLLQQTTHLVSKMLYRHLDRWNVLGGEW